MSDVVIRAEGLTKEYQLGVINYGTLQQDIQSWWARLRGKGDPNSCVQNDHANRNRVFRALDDVSFCITEGDVVGIIGRNGAGKSTLLKVLSRITAPTSGSVHIRGRVASLLEVGTGFHPELTGRENVFLNGAILGLREEEVRRKFDEIVAFSEVSNFIDTPVKRYSSGMYVRLAFAVAAHLEPEILIVDEVLAVGDLPFQKKCLGKMEAMSKSEGRTVLLVSHNLSTVASYCQSTLLVENGKLISQGPTTDIVAQYIDRLHGESSSIYTREMISSQNPYLKSAEILNSENTPGNVFKSCEKISFVFEVMNIKKGISFNFSIYNSTGVKIVNFNTLNFSREDKESSSGKIICEIEELMLSEGAYRINAAIIEGPETLEHIESALVFDVWSAPVLGRNIVNNNFGTNVLMHHRWHIPR